MLGLDEADISPREQGTLLLPPSPQRPQTAKFFSGLTVTGVRVSSADEEKSAIGRVSRAGRTACSLFPVEKKRAVYSRQRVGAFHMAFLRLDYVVRRVVSHQTR